MRSASEEVPAAVQRADHVSCHHPPDPRRSGEEAPRPGLGRARQEAFPALQATRPPGVAGDPPP